MELVDLYKQFRNPQGFNNGKSYPEGLYEVRNIIVNILNAALKDTNWEAYSSDKIPGPLSTNRYMIDFRIKPWDSEIRPLETNAIDILRAAEKDWELHTTISLVRRD